MDDLCMEVESLNAVAYVSMFYRLLTVANNLPFHEREQHAHNSPASLFSPNLSNRTFKLAFHDYMSDRCTLPEPLTPRFSVLYHSLGSPLTEIFPPS